MSKICLAKNRFFVKISFALDHSTVSQKELYQRPQYYETDHTRSTTKVALLSTTAGN